MKRYLLDTSVIVSYLRGKKEFIDFLPVLEGEITSSFVCLAELFEGVFRVNDGRAMEKTVLEFFSGLNEIFGLDTDTARVFGQIRSELKRKGSVIEDLDILIAATCIANNLDLVTLNPKHFNRVKGLKLLPLPPSPKKF